MVQRAWFEHLAGVVQASFAAPDPHGRRMSYRASTLMAIVGMSSRAYSNTSTPSKACKIEASSSHEYRMSSVFSGMSEAREPSRASIRIDCSKDCEASDLMIPLAAHPLWPMIAILSFGDIVRMLLFWGDFVRRIGLLSTLLVFKDNVLIVSNSTDRITFKTTPLCKR